MSTIETSKKSNKGQIVLFYIVPKMSSVEKFHCSQKVVVRKQKDKVYFITVLKVKMCSRKKSLGKIIL